MLFFSSNKRPWCGGWKSCGGLNRVVGNACWWAGGCACQSGPWHFGCLLGWTTRFLRFRCFPSVVSCLSCTRWGSAFPRSSRCWPSELRCLNGAFWLKVALSLQASLIRQRMDAGMLLKLNGGWLDDWWTYAGVLLGLLNKEFSPVCWGPT